MYTNENVVCSLSAIVSLSTLKPYTARAGDTGTAGTTMAVPVFEKEK